ncbi:MAG TPA: Gfo/Idh/MocA family oxidoreductase [Acidimicrobiia bacterium]|jgi:myo-inositol 2-dehydrogenase/D-chiro-inositol 1-dehydrogenase|nr:Gfo/Idh/MocA family oxidoreductase [Acidimicrobiia bacterium]
MDIGVIGVGRIGAFHAATLADLPSVDRVVIADIDAERTATLAAERGYEEASSVDDLLGKVGAVVIASSTDTHAQFIHASVDAGLTTFCEKPISLDLESTRGVVEHVRRSGATLQMGFQRRFDPGFRAASELVLSGGLGNLYLVRMAGHDPAPPHESYIPQSGGIFRDFSVHDFDALRFVTGREVEEVYADGSVIGFPVFASYDDVDTAVATVRLRGGALGVLSVNRHDPRGYDIRMELIGSEDAIAVGWDERMPLRSVEPGMPPPPAEAWANFQQRFEPAYRAELSAFLEVAAGRRKNPCTPEDALEALRVAVACDLSRAEHRPVRLEEVS